MLKVQKLGIVCPVCGKPDGCLVADDGTAAICARISEGSCKKVGKGGFRGGWLHILGEFKPKKYTVPEKPFVDWNKWANVFAHNLRANSKAFCELCVDQRINILSAMRFNIGWTEGWLTVPIYSMMRKVSGIQRRQGNKKRYIKYSDIGVFVPSAFFQDWSKTVAVCEGWTDTLTAYDYGLNSIGKINCWCGNDEVLMYLKTHPTIERVIIFADDNEPDEHGNCVGLEGAKETEALLKENDFKTKLVLTPEKDLRACHQNGMSLSEVMGD
jgi:hypothetical protein